MNYILQLNVKKEWFDMIASGIKKEEYREIKAYWVARLCELDYTKPGVHSGVHPKSAESAFHFCVGYKAKRGLAIKYLLETGASIRNFNTVCFKNGYAKDAPEIMVEFKGVEIGAAKPEWSNNWLGEVFIIKLGEIIKTT